MIGGAESNFSLTKQKSSHQSKREPPGKRTDTLSYPQRLFHSLISSLLNFRCRAQPTYRRKINISSIALTALQKTSCWKALVLIYYGNDVNLTTFRFSLIWKLYQPNDNVHILTRSDWGNFTSKIISSTWRYPEYTICSYSDDISTSPVVCTVGYDQSRICIRGGRVDGHPMSLQV